MLGQSITLGLAMSSRNCAVVFVGATFGCTGIVNVLLENFAASNSQTQFYKSIYSSTSTFATRGSAFSPAQKIGRSTELSTLTRRISALNPGSRYWTIIPVSGLRRDTRPVVQPAAQTSPVLSR